MRNSLWILLVLGVLMGVLPVIVSADLITEANVTSYFTIDDGDGDDSHDENGWLVAGSGITSKIGVAYNGTISPEIRYVRFNSREKGMYGDFEDGKVIGESYDAVFHTSGNTAGNAPIDLQINVTAVENSSVTINQEVRFTNTSPEDLLLTVNPQSMPSADVKDTKGADILVKVLDENGNGISGERVDFWILSKTEPYCEARMAEPTPDAFTASTNGDGIATVHFTPGRFVVNDTGNHYTQTASESCTVVAKWGAKSGLYRNWSRSNGI